MMIDIKLIEFHNFTFFSFIAIQYGGWAAILKFLVLLLLLFVIFESNPVTLISQN